MLILYSHILINLRDAAKRMKNAKRQELEFQEQNVRKIKYKNKKKSFSVKFQLSKSLNSSELCPKWRETLYNTGKGENH